MYQEQVDAPQPNVFDALATSLERFLHAATSKQDLGRDEDLVPGNARFSNSLPNLDFVLVVLRGVDVTIAASQRLETRSPADIGRRPIDAESEARDVKLGVGVFEADGRRDVEIGDGHDVGIGGGHGVGIGGGHDAGLE